MLFFFFPPCSSQLLRLKHTHGLNYTARRTDSVTADCEKRALLPSLLTTDRKTQSKHLPPLLNLPPLYAFFPVSQLIKNPSIPLTLLSPHVSSQSQRRETLCSSLHAKTCIHKTLRTQQHQPVDAKCPAEAPRQKPVLLLHECFCNAASGQRRQHRAAPSPREREKELLQLSRVAAQALKVTSTRFTRGNQPACYAKCSLTVFNCPPCWWWWWWRRGGLFFSHHMQILGEIWGAGSCPTALQYWYQTVNPCV